MKKVTETSDFREFESKQFVSFHREELDEVLNLLEPYGDVSIKSGGYEFESLDELKNYFENNTPDLNIQLRGKKKEGDFYTYSLTLNFKKGSHASLTSYREEGNLFFQIKETLIKNVSFYRTIFNPAFIIVFIYITPCFAIFNYMSGDQFPKEDSLPIFFIYLIGLVFISCIAVVLYSKYLWSIDLNTKHAANPIQKNKDKIIVGIIVAAITTIINWLIFRP